jgi:CubicO group peptidase (beta-lactamase class C family)
MMLVEEGKLMLLDPLPKYIPEFAKQKVAIVEGSDITYVEPRRAITIQDLFRHTSGLAYDFVGTGPVQKLYQAAGLHSRNRTNEELCRALADLPLYNQPGKSWDYSFSTDVLGRVIEVITGKSLRDVLLEKIFIPLGMNETDFLVPPEKHARLAEPYPKDAFSGELNTVYEPRKIPNLQSAGGGLISTAHDYARFLQMLINGGTLAGARLLGRMTVEFMTSNHLGRNVTIGSDLLPPGYGFGLGFAVRTEPGLSSSPGSVGQYFWGGIAGTTFFVDPREELFALSLIQAPVQRDYYRVLFRNLVYAAIDS